MTNKFLDVTVSSNIDLTVELDRRELERDVYEYEFLLRWDEEQAQDPVSQVTLLWMLPCVDVQYMWHPESRCRRVLDADWRLKIDSMLTGSAPLAVLFNAGDVNTYTFATDEVKKVTSVQFGVNDGRDAVTGKISMGLQQFVGRSSHRLRVRADFRRLPFHRVIDDVRAWWEQVLDLVPMPVPAVGRMPMYSSWYNFHKDIHADVLEAECGRAKALGMDAIIIDDGWQTADGLDGEGGAGGYRYTGDWEICEAKFPDFKAFVKKIHDTGMKAILWFSVPFLGYGSQNWEKYKDKIIYKVNRNGAGVLDPRYTEVREFLISTYERFLRDYDLDGFKLDFIDRFHMTPEDQVKPGMDYDCIQEATDRLMTDVMERLRSIKPDILIEFRQKYIGPAMRRFGNLFRVSDCPCDITTNRVGIADLRLMSGSTAVHSDMVVWNNDETVEDAALQILNCMFGTIQFSKHIEKMTQEHKEMSAFWLNFARENEKLLQESEFIPYEPNYLYPVIKAQDEKEEIIGVYALNKVVPLDPGKQRSRLINATKRDALYLSVKEAVTVKFRTWDARGRQAGEGTAALGPGIHELPVPRSGLLEVVYVQ